jgi:acyl carrier protein
MKNISEKMSREYKEEVFKKLTGILKDDSRIEKLIKKEKIKLTKDTKFFEDLGMDSLDVYEFLFKIEEEYNMIIPNEKIYELKAISDCMDYLSVKELERR